MHNESDWIGCIPTTLPDFVVQRVAYGTVPDGRLDLIYAGVAKVPVRGAYQYLRSNWSWKAQADLFLSLVKSKDYHFYVCDFEGMYNTMSVDFVAMAAEWLGYVSAQTGKPVVIYSNISGYQDYLSKDYRIKNYPFWLAWPPSTIPDPQVSTPATPASRKDWLFWQYSFGEHNTLGSLYGVGRKGCDVDVFNGTIEELYAWARVNTTPPAPEYTQEEKVNILWREAGKAGWNLAK